LDEHLVIKVDEEKLTKRGNGFCGGLYCYCWWPSFHCIRHLLSAWKIL